METEAPTAYILVQRRVRTCRRDQSTQTHTIAGPNEGTIGTEEPEDLSPSPKARKESLEPYKANFMKVHTPGRTHEEVVKTYDEWAKTYDEDLCLGRYYGPEVVADIVSKFYVKEERERIRILDVAAGTGRVGVALNELGFKRIDALDSSKGMLDVLSSKNVYEKKFECAIGFRPISNLRPDSYDCVVMVGGLGEGHLPVQSFDEILRIVRPGGMIVVALREADLKVAHKCIKGNLEGFIQMLLNKGLCIMLQANFMKNFVFDENGIIFCLQKTEI